MFTQRKEGVLTVDCIEGIFQINLQHRPISCRFPALQLIHKTLQGLRHQVCCSLQPHTYLV